MALRVSGTGQYAHTTAQPWTGGSVTIAFWMRKGDAFTRFVSGFVDTDDSTPQSSGDPRISVGTEASNRILATYVGAGGTSNNVNADSYSVDTWHHVVAVFRGSGTTLTQTAAGLDGTLDTFSTSTSRDLSTNGTLDQIWIGVNGVNDNLWIAHYAVFLDELDSSQITELQTKTPDAITGATPVIYCPFLVDETNEGSGGATYDFTLSSATIDSTNDGTLPSLSGSGGASGTISVTTEVVGVSITGEAPVNGTISVTTVETQVSITGSAGSASNDIRLQPSLYLERGGYAASLTADRWIVFTSDLSAVEDTGTALSINSTGQPTIDITGSASYVVGDYVPLFLTVYDEGSAAPDRTVRTFFGWVEAIAQA